MVPIAFNGTSLATLFNTLLCLRLYNAISHIYNYVQLFASSAFKANILMWSNELKNYCTTSVSITHPEIG